MDNDANLLGSSYSTLFPRYMNSILPSFRFVVTLCLASTLGFASAVNGSSIALSAAGEVKTRRCLLDEVEMHSDSKSESKLESESESESESKLESRLKSSETKRCGGVLGKGGERVEDKRLSFAEVCWVRGGESVEDKRLSVVEVCWVRGERVWRIRD